MILITHSMSLKPYQKKDHHAKSVKVTTETLMINNDVIRKHSNNEYQSHNLLKTLQKKANHVEESLVVIIFHCRLKNMKKS